MKKLLIIGACHTELVTYVKELPRGNEDIHKISERSAAAGTGYYAALLMQKLGLPFTLITTVGSGIYGEMAAEALQNAGIAVPDVSEDLAGCSYRLAAENGKEAYLAVAGNEYDFNEEAASDVDPDETGMVLCDSSLLSGGNAQELIRFLEDLDKPVYLVLGERLDETDEDALEAMLSLNPVLILRDREAWIAQEEENGIRTAAEALTDMNHNTVMILNDEGVYCLEDKEAHFAECEDETGAAFFAAGYLAARLAGVGHRNSLVFGLETSSLMTDAFMPEDTDMEEAKKRLAEMILHG